VIGHQPEPGTSPSHPAVPRWIQAATLALSLAGLGISAYLTISHYLTPATLACPDTGIVNCAKVTTSPESVILGIPVALLGLLFYVFMAAITTPRAWRGHAPLLRRARVGGLVAGVAFAVYLIYTELFTLDAICLWCTAVHVITVALFALVIPTAISGEPVPVPAAGSGARRQA
jgi:uncharacterized membrane protein